MPHPLPQIYRDLIGVIEQGIRKLEAGGGSDESAADVARGIEVELAQLRRAAEKRRGDPDGQVRQRLKDVLADYSLRIFRAAKGRSS